MLSNDTRLLRYKIIYKFPESPDEYNGHMDHIQKFVNFLDADININVCYLLSINVIKITSILVEYESRKLVSSLKNDLEKLGFSSDRVTIKKVEGLLKTIKNNYIIIGLREDTLPYVCNFPNKRYLSVINLHFFRSVNM
jgi:hypothetical protein